MLKGGALLLLFMDNWEYLDWLALTNILLAGLCFASVIIKFHSRKCIEKGRLENVGHLLMMIMASDRDNNTHMV